MLNRALKHVADGTVVASVDLSCATGVRSEVGRVTVYWPFVVVQRSRRGWNVTHAPSGYRACEAGSRRLAVAKIQTLRALADWEWRSPTSKKAARARRAAKDHLPPLHGIG